MKYEDGPCISFRSKQKKIEGNWLLKYYTVDGVDSLQYWNSHFENECNFGFYPWDQLGLQAVTVIWGDITSQYYTSGGSYQIKDEHLYISLNEDASSSNFPFNVISITSDWLITKLKYKDVWFEVMVDGKSYSLHFENVNKF